MVWERLTSKGTFERRPPSGPLPPSLSWSSSPAPPCLTRSTLCFTTLLQAHWPSRCSSNLPSSSLPQNLSAFRSFCPESSSSRSSGGSRPHLIQVSAPVSTPQGGAPPSTHSPLHWPYPGASWCLSQHGFITVCWFILSLTRKRHKARNCVLFATLWYLVHAFWFYFQ